MSATWGMCGDLDCFISWMDHWQTMLTGVGAIGAAAISIHYLRKQIADAETQEVRRRSRRLAAARARLQLSLSDAIHYANEAMGLLKQYLDAISGPGVSAELAALQRPILPEQAILSFEAMVEATDDDAFAGLIADMISELQVLNSRIHGMLDDGPGLNPMNLHSYLMGAAKIHGYASSMYEYARREVDDPPHALDWDQAITGLNLNDIRHNHYSDLHAFMGRAKARAEQATSTE